jgi:hypothetical protein
LMHGEDRRRPKLIESPTLLLTAWLVVPFVGAYAVSMMSKSVLVPHYLIISIPAAYLLLARGITQLPIRRAFQTSLVVLIVVWSLVNLIVQRQYYSTPTKEQFREAVQFIVDDASQAGQDAPVLGVAYSPKFFDYYFEKQGSKRRIAMLVGQPDDVPRVRDFLQRENPDCFWYISSTYTRMPSSEFASFLSANTTPVFSKSFLRFNASLLKPSLRRDAK